VSLICSKKSKEYQRVTVLQFQGGSRILEGGFVKRWRTKSPEAAMISANVGYSALCLKNVPPLTCYNLYIHGSIATIFGKNVADKVGNQNVLCFPTSPNYCFCTTWGNRKPRNCVFSLKCCMLFTKKHETQLKKSPGQS